MNAKRTRMPKGPKKAPPGDKALKLLEADNLDLIDKVSALKTLCNLACDHICDETIAKLVRRRLDALTVILLACLITGCASQGPPMPPMPWSAPRAQAKSAQAKSAQAKYAGAIMRTVTVAWNNYGYYEPGWVTGLEGTTNLTSWYVLAEMPYKNGEVRVTLTNRPPCECYRAYNSIKP